MDLSLSPEDIKRALKELKNRPATEQAEIARLLEAAEEDLHIQRCRDDFLTFVKMMWPGFIEGEHHRQMAKAFQDIAAGTEKRITISMAPRSGKSKLTSVYFPAWFLGKFPHKKVLQVSHKAELAVGFGREVRELFSDPLFRKVFPGITLKADNKAAGRWGTNKGGTYYATGVGAGLGGWGGDLVLADDVHADTDAPLALYDPSVFDKVYNWFMVGPRQRLQPGAAIAVISTRWGERDIIGRLKEDEKTRGGDKYKSLTFPAIVVENGIEKSYWPEFWPLKELQATKRSVTAAESSWMWNAAYMQNPTAEEGALIKSAWWNSWDKPIPDCEFVIQAWDTASRATQRSNFSVCTTWGVFYHHDDPTPQILLIDCWRDKKEFWELKEAALELYRQYRPDACVIEAKNAGEGLISEFRKMGLFVESFMPTRGDGDKVMRVNAIVDIFAAGVVWIKEAPWTTEVLSEAQAFPLGVNDDIVDTIAMALSRFRRGNFIRLPLDEEDEYEVNYLEKADYY